ncbi:HECT domain ubiquitin transferase (macronuclear) [Tetrahymena thermophila SB210]|uniref:HECT-type E3 ubiquitin transferase n=1 Tax=Tetrahymena thermophila (strain SB210) TaxID=312017 RepID=I7MJP1_TETTS|nr:HECT domain ubiquitin transferase [Tetrahymena thermophila SB210]EAS07044.2 HECT domain ubiquitin transferase [Tetrahymena thermophila SB210]|eukprot:XP_001027286.2 HECT domain ubiquitin transferase [Tetrahymena thermophila SB210]
MEIEQSHCLLFARPFWLHNQGDDQLMKEYCQLNEFFDQNLKKIIVSLKKIKEIQISSCENCVKENGHERNTQTIQQNEQSQQADQAQSMQNQLVKEFNLEDVQMQISQLEQELLETLLSVEKQRKYEIQKFYDGKRHSNHFWNYFVRMGGIFQHLQYLNSLEVIYRIYKLANMFQTEILQENVISSYFDNNNISYNIFARFYHFFMTIHSVHEEYLDKIAFTDDMTIRINIKRSQIQEIVEKQENKYLSCYGLTKLILSSQNGINLSYSDYNHSFLRLLLAVIYLRTKQNKKIWRQLRAVCVWRHRDNVAKHKKFKVSFTGEQAVEASIPTEYFNYLRQIKEEGFENAQNLEIEECLSQHQAHWPDENDFPKIKGSFFELIDNYVSNLNHIYPSFLIRIMTLVEHGINQEIYARSQKIEQDLQIGQNLQVKLSKLIQNMTDNLNDESTYYNTQIITYELPELPDKVNLYQDILQNLCIKLIFEKQFYRKSLGWYLFYKDANKRSKQQQIMEIIDKIYAQKELYYIGVQIYSDFVYNFESCYSIQTINKIIEMIEYCSLKKYLISRNFNFKCLEILVERFALDKQMKLRLAYLINRCILVVNQKIKDKANINCLIESRAPLFIQDLFDFLDQISISPDVNQIYQDFAKRWVLSMTSQLLLQISNNRSAITEDNVRGILEKFSNYFTDKRNNEFINALNEFMPKELLHRNIIKVAYQMIKEKEKDCLSKRQFLYCLIKYCIPMQKILEEDFLNELKNDASIISERYLLKSLVVICQKFQFEHITSSIYPLLLQNKSIDLNLLLRNVRNSSEMNQIFLNIKHASILKSKYINKKEIIKDIILLQPNNLKGEVLLLLQPMTSSFLQNLQSAIRQILKDHQGLATKHSQIANMINKTKNYELNLKKCEKSITILKHQQDMVQQLIELLLSQEHAINDVISFIILYTELLYKDTKTRQAFYVVFIKQCLPYLKYNLGEKYKQFPSFNVNNCPLIKQIETLEEEKSDIQPQSLLQIKCNSLDYFMQLIENLGQHSNINLKMNYFSSFEELVECEINGKEIDSKQIKYLSRYLISMRESVSYSNIFQAFEIIHQSVQQKQVETQTPLFVHDIGLCILTLALKIFMKQQNKSKNDLNDEFPEIQKIFKVIEIILEICPSERRFYSMIYYILESQFQFETNFIKANIELRFKNLFYEANSFVFNSFTILEFSKKLAEVDLYQYPIEYFNVLVSMFTYNQKDLTIKLSENILPEFQFSDYTGSQVGLFEEILEKFIKTKSDFYLCFIAEICRKYPTYLKNLVQWRYTDEKDIFDFILENQINFNYNLGVFLNLLCNQNYSFFMLENGLIQGTTGNVIPALIGRTLDFISKCQLNSEKDSFTLQGALNVLKYLKPKFTYLDHMKTIITFIDFVSKQKTLQILTLLERLGILSDIQASLKIVSASELGDYKHAKYFFFRNIQKFLTEENRMKSIQFTKELKEKLQYCRTQDNYNLPILSNITGSPKNQKDEPLNIPQNIKNGLKLRYFTDKMNNKIQITYSREDLSTYEQDLIKYNLDFSQSDEYYIIQFISQVKKNQRAFDGIDGDVNFKRVVLEALDIQGLSENEKKFETIITQIFKLSLKQKTSQPASNTKLSDRQIPDSSSLAQELDEKFKTVKKIKERLEQESAANQKEAQEKIDEQQNGLLEDIEEQQKKLEQQKQELIKQYDQLLQDSLKQQHVIKKLSADFTNHKKPQRRQFLFDSYNFPNNSLTLYQIDEETFYNASHNEKIRLLNEGKQTLHQKNLLKKLKIAVQREQYSLKKFISKMQNEKLAEKLDLQSQFDANFESFMSICNEHEKQAILLTFDQRYLKQLPEKWRNEANKIRKQHMNKGEEIKLQESEEEEEKNSKEEEKDFPSYLTRIKRNVEDIPKRNSNSQESQQNKRQQNEKEDNSVIQDKLFSRHEDIEYDEEQDDNLEDNQIQDGFEDRICLEVDEGIQQIHKSLRSSEMKQRQKTSIEVEQISSEIASLKQASLEMQKQFEAAVFDGSPHLFANLKNTNISVFSSQMDTQNQIEKNSNNLEGSIKNLGLVQSQDSNQKEQKIEQSQISIEKIIPQQVSSLEQKINDNEQQAKNQQEEKIKNNDSNEKNQLSQEEQLLQMQNEKAMQELQIQQQKLLIQKQIEEQERMARQIYEQEQEIVNNQKDDYYDYEDFDAINQQLILDQISKEREERELKKQQLLLQQLEEQKKQVEDGDKIQQNSSENSSAESNLTEEEKYLQKNFSQSLPYSQEKEKKYSSIDFYLKSLYVDSNFFLNILRLLINRGLDEYQEYQNNYLEILYILSFNPFNNYKVVQILKGMTVGIIQNQIQDKNTQYKVKTHYLKQYFKYESDEKKANNQQCFNVFQLTQSILDYEIFNWYYFVLYVNKENQFEETFKWNYSILEKNIKYDESLIKLAIRKEDEHSDIMAMNSWDFSLINLLEKNIHSIIETQHVIEKSDDYSVSITQLRQNYDATFNLILKFLGKFNISTNLYRKITSKLGGYTQSQQQNQQADNNLEKTTATISAETYPEMKFQINVSNSFFEAYYTYSFHLKGSRKTSLKKMNNILYDLLRKKMIENYESFENMSLQILKINREVINPQIISCNQFVKNYRKLAQEQNQLKNLNGTEEIAQSKRYIFHNTMEKNYENMFFQLGTLRRTIKNLIEIFNEMFEVQCKLDLEKEYELRKSEDGQTKANEWLDQQKKELRKELLQKLQQVWMSQLKDLYVYLYEILYQSIQLMSEKLDSSKFTYDRFNLSVKSVVVLYDFFYSDNMKLNVEEDAEMQSSTHIHQFKEPLVTKHSSKEADSALNSEIDQDQNKSLSDHLNKQFSQVLNTDLEQINLSDLYFIIEQKFIGLIVLFIETSERKKKWLEFMKKVGHLKIRENKNLSMEFKMSYLKIVCEIEANKKKKTKHYGFDYYGDFQPEIRLNINRDEIWMSTIAELSKQDSASLVHQQLIINFEGEAGIDQGGMAREWINLALKDVLDPRKGLFALSSNKITLQPNPLSCIIPDYLLHFRFAGRLVGLALTNKIDFEIDLTRSFLKHILRKQLCVSDYEDIDPKTAKNLLWMLENDVTGSDLTYTITQDILGIRVEKDLIKNGNKIEINNQNKVQFVKDYLHYKMTSEIQQQLESFISGFYDVVHPSALVFFDERDLGLRLAGSKKIDIEDMKKNTKYSGNYDQDSHQIKWLWEVLEQFDEEMKQSFIFFLTGAFKVPFGGFEQNPIEVYDKLGNTNSLPIAHTCFNKLELPAYQSKNQLKEKLTQAILEGHKGFHIS